MCAIQMLPTANRSPLQGLPGGQVPSHFSENKGMRITIREESLVVRSLLSSTSDMREEQTFRSFRCRWGFFASFVFCFLYFCKFG